MRIAVVSKDGKTVDEHFGRAERFLVYEVTDTGPVFVEERPTVPLSVGDPDHPFDPDRFAEVVANIADCTQVFCTRIGEVPKAKLEERGIRPVTSEGPIADVLP
jgi:nitrogen fixation protein NifB